MKCSSRWVRAKDPFKLDVSTNTARQTQTHTKIVYKRKDM